MKLAGDILILIMMILSNGRVLVIRKPHLDPLVMLAPLSFLLASLSLFAFSVDIFSIAIFIISILVLLSNFHALFRYGSRLVVDRYSVLMKTWAFITTILATGTLITLIIFSPVTVMDRTCNVQETQHLYSGSFASGFTPTERFSTANVFFTEFSLKENANSEETEISKDTSKDILLFLSDKRGDTVSYKPYLHKLTEKGYTVCSLDFYAKDMKWIHSIEDSRMMRKFGLIVRCLLNPKKYESQKEFYTFNYSKELNSCLKLVLDYYGKDSRIILITDGMAYTAGKDTASMHSDIIKKVFDISTVSEYKTSGYGFIEQTDPLLAFIQGYKKDTNQTAATACAEATVTFIEEK